MVKVLVYLVVTLYLCIKFIYYIPLQVVFGKIKLMKGETLPVLVKSLIVHAMME